LTSMDLFDVVSKGKSLSEVAEEWRESDRDPRSGARHRGQSGTTFEHCLQRVISCHRALVLRAAEPGCDQNSLAVDVEALGVAVRTIASNEAWLESLLATKEATARQLLDALQMVRFEIWLYVLGLIILRSTWI
jgi:hypothetical protein